MKHMVLFGMSLLEDILAAGDLSAINNILLNPKIGDAVRSRTGAWRQIVQSATTAHVPVPALSANLAYVDSLGSARLSTHFIQAQRDYFGAHTFERTDVSGVFHADWQAKP